MKMIKAILFGLLFITALKGSSQCGACTVQPQVNFSFPSGSNPHNVTGGTINLLSTDWSSQKNLIVYTSPHPYSSLNTQQWLTTVQVFINANLFVEYTHSSGSNETQTLIPATSINFPIGINIVTVKTICPNDGNKTCTIGTYTVKVENPSANITITKNCCSNTYQTITFYMSGATNIPGAKIKVMAPGSTMPKYFTFLANTNTTCFRANGNYTISLVNASNTNITPPGWSNYTITKSKLDCPKLEKNDNFPPNGN